MGGHHKIHLSMPKRWTDGVCVYVIHTTCPLGNASDLVVFKKRSCPWLRNELVVWLEG